MLVERTTNNEIVITVSSSVDSFGVQRLIDYARYLEATAQSKAKQADADALAEEVNASWWLTQGSSACNFSCYQH